MELVSLVIGIAGFLFGLFMYFKNRSSQEMTVIYASQPLPAKRGQGVEMLYLGQPVSELTRYDITLFNSGSKDIRQADLKSGLALRFENLGIVSHTAGFKSAGVNPQYRTCPESIAIDFDSMRPNDHVTVEVLVGGAGDGSTPPVCDAQLRDGQTIKIHEQGFDEATRNSKYDNLVRHLWVAIVSFCVGLVLLGVAFFSKYQASLANKGLDLREQLTELLRVNSLAWFSLFVFSTILLLFAYEVAKVIAPKFRRYKFEQLIQNKG